MIGFTGPRDLNQKFQPLVCDVTNTIWEHGVAVGCASGLDAMVADSIHVPYGLDIFAVFGPDGDGAAKSSNVAKIKQMSDVGYKVHWWAGGKDSNLNKRLSNRSLAMVTAVANSTGKKGIIGFPNKAPSNEFRKYGNWYSCHSGTWGTIATAAAIGLPVVVFKCGDFALPSLPVAGDWVESQNGGVWLGSYIFKPE